MSRFWVARSPQSRAIILAALASVFGAVIGVAALRTAPAKDSASAELSPIDFRENPIGPGAERMSGMPSNVTALPFDVLLPTSVNGSANIDISWVRVTPEPALAVQLTSGMLLTERLAEAIDFPTDRYYAQLGEGVLGASIQLVNDSPALVIQSSPELDNPSSVDIILRGVHISIIGNPGQDVAELVSLASEIPAQGAGSPPPA
jgi:hypothetical protein